jgi:hypothetical protein
MRELEASGRITRGDGWITIPNLTEHQKPDIRYFTTCDKEGCDDPPEKVSQRESRRVHGVHTKSARSEPGVSTAGARADGDGEGDGEGESRVGARYQIERVEIVKRDGTVLSVKAFGSALKKDGSVGKNAASEYMHSQSAWPQWLRDVIDGLA